MQPTNEGYQVTLQFIIVLIYYLALIWPMRVFWSSTMDVWLEATEGYYPRHRVRIMKSANMLNILAAVWPITIWIVFAHIIWILLHAVSQDEYDQTMVKLDDAFDDLGEWAENSPDEDPDKT
jgi:hypothetical protein